PFAVSRTRRPPVDPIVVLVVVALIPALLLWGLFRWSSNRADIAADAAPLTSSTPADAPPVTAEFSTDDPTDDPVDSPVDPVTTDEPPSVALATELLSFRRSAGELSRDLNMAAFQVAVQPFLSALNDRSCAAISLDGREVGAARPDLVVIPASNQKILVAAAALDVLGDTFTYTTTVVGPAPSGGVINGDVYLVGGGDPLLSGEWYPDADLDRLPAFNITSVDELARQLVAAGVTQINGVIRGDGSRYDDEFSAPGWGDGVAGLEAGPYDALLVNDARVRNDDQRGSDPNEAAAREFVRILGEQGIAVSGGAGTGTAPPELAQLASVASQPIAAVIEEMLTNSDNNTAELMVKEIGLASAGSGTRTAGLDAIESVIAGWGIDTTGLVLGDGSGLSLDNRVTCAQMLGVLQHAGYDSPVGQGLAVAGETGTLADVFGDTAVAGRLRGKTGTLNNTPYDADPPAVKALSGFLPVDGGGAIEYVMILNGPTINDQAEYRPIWAEMVAALTSFPAVASPAALGPQ
ncbi:MAG: D-alanyl-D-alanine carboxypeptidase/D-alanyl-D-alanine-endopeptidase, partial [Ilumatobacteraceae bacterium]